jgi:hypothetical protein
MGKNSFFSLIFGVSFKSFVVWLPEWEPDSWKILFFW